MQVWSGMYSKSIVAKSGCPVLGQTLVNSGQMCLIVKLRCGAGFGKVSKMLDMMRRLQIISGPPFCLLFEPYGWDPDQTNFEAALVSEIGSVPFLSKARSLNSPYAMYLETKKFYCNHFFCQRAIIYTRVHKITTPSNIEILTPFADFLFESKKILKIIFGFSYSYSYNVSSKLAL